MTSKLLDVAGEGGIPIEEEEDYVAATDRGWRWKPKGLKQVLFESGWIDPGNRVVLTSSLFERSWIGKLSFRQVYESTQEPEFLLMLNYSCDGMTMS